MRTVSLFLQGRAQLQRLWRLCSTLLDEVLDGLSLVLQLVFISSGWLLICVFDTGDAKEKRKKKEEKKKHLTLSTKPLLRSSLIFSDHRNRQSCLVHTPPLFNLLCYSCFKPRHLSLFQSCWTFAMGQVTRRLGCQRFSRRLNVVFTGTWGCEKQSPF